MVLLSYNVTKGKILDMIHIVEALIKLINTLVNIRILQTLFIMEQSLFNKVVSFPDCGELIL